MRRARGIGLVELMVAMAISLLITLVIMTAYLGGVSTQRSQSDMTRLQEAARFAYLLLAKELKKSGHRNPNSYPNANTGAPPAPFCVDGVAGFAGSALAPANDPSTLTLGDGATATVLNRSDSVTVRFYGDDLVANTPENAPTPDPAIVDCLGNTVGQATLDSGLVTNFAGQQTLVEDTLYVAADANSGEPSLFCSSTTRVSGTVTRTATVALIPGVESVQLLYGEDSDGDAQVDRYVTAANLGSTFNILNVMVSVVIRTQNRIDMAAAQRVFNHFGEAYAPSGAAPNGDAGSVFAAPLDQRMRAHFSSTVALRNFPTCQ
ncbi:MAG: PilW family protein [Candidatus Methylumidiphilus sp.]